MPISLLITLLTYLLSYRSNGGDKTKAAISALAAGGATYYAATQTEWGADLSDDFNSAIGYTTDSDSISALKAQREQGALDIKNPPAGSSAWDVLKEWGAQGTALVAGTVAVGASGDKTLLYLGLGVAAIFLLT